MKKIIIALMFTIISTVAFANSGKFNASGMGSWEMNIMNAGNGNMAITYDGNAGLADKDPNSIFDKSTMNCVGGLTLVGGKFEDETGMCTFYLADGEKISGTGFSSRQNLKGKQGFAHSMNQMSGEYKY